MAQNNPSFVLVKQNEVVFEDRPVPKLKTANDVIVAIQYTGICGSDVHYLTHGAIGSFILKAPMVLGHESSGIISEVGSEVHDLKVGDRVAVEPSLPCRRCKRCKEGRYNLCPYMAFASTPPVDGTLARFYSLPSDFCFKLPDHVSLEEGALVEPLAVAVHVTRQASITPGASVVVFGAGPVGLLCCAVAKSFGASKIITVDINEERLAFAQKYAATHAFRSQKTSAEDNATRMIDECGLEPGADVVIEATGAEPCIQTGIHVVRPGGTYVQAGMGKSDVTYPIGAACAKELTVKGSFRYSSGDYELAVQLIASGKINVNDLITGKVPFKEAERAFEGVKKGEGIKTLIKGPEES